MRIDAAKPHNQDRLSVPFSHAEIVDELDRVSRTALSKKGALRKMLRFVVEATLDGKASELKEYTIATLVFGKPENFDPRFTSLVRTQASKLRDALVAHYSSFPHPNGPWLWVPPGSYRAVFDQNPALHAKGHGAEDIVDVASVVSKNVRIVEPTVFPRSGKLGDIVAAVVHLQRENFTRRNLIVSLPGMKVPVSTAAKITTELEVQQTIVELDGCILLTLVITAVPSRCVLLGNSILIPWSGDPARTIAALADPLSQFASSCASFIGLQTVTEIGTPSTGSSIARWKKGDVGDGVLVRQSFATHADPRSGM